MPVRYVPSQLQGIDGLYHFSAPLDAGSLEGVERLAILARHGVGLDFVDVEACTERGVAVTITPDGVTHPMASAAVTLVLALAHRLRERDRALHAGAWGEGRFEPTGTGLVGRTLGVIGYGRIGREIVRLLAPWGMDVLVTQRTPVSEPGVTWVGARAAARSGRRRRRRVPADGRDARPPRRAAAGADEADGDARQRRARGDRRPGSTRRCAPGRAPGGRGRRRRRPGAAPGRRSAARAAERRRRAALARLHRRPRARLRPGGLRRRCWPSPRDGRRPTSSTPPCSRIRSSPRSWPGSRSAERDEVRVRYPGIRSRASTRENSASQRRQCVDVANQPRHPPTR